MRRDGMFGNGVCALVLGIGLAVWGCGQSPDEAGDPNAPPGSDPPGSGPQMMPPPPPKNPVGVPITLVLEEFEVKPGTERQVCKRFNLPVQAPMEVVRIHSVMSGTSHHVNVYKAVGKDVSAPVPPEQSRVYDCQPAAEQFAGTAAYIFGAATPEKYYDTPTGVSFQLQPGHQIIVEQHVINASPKVIKGKVTLDLNAAAPDAKIAHHADVMWMGLWGFYLPPLQTTSSSAHCNVPYDVEVFGLWSHTHSLGSHFSMDRWAGRPGGRIYDSTDWEHPLSMPFEPAAGIKAGEGLQWTCTWKNTRNTAVLPGKNSTDEMCIAFAAAYPSKTLDGPPIQCNIFF